MEREGGEGEGGEAKGGDPRYFIAPRSSSFLEICLTEDLRKKTKAILTLATTNRQNSE